MYSTGYSSYRLVYRDKFGLSKLIPLLFFSSVNTLYIIVTFVVSYKNCGQNGGWTKTKLWTKSWECFLVITLLNNSLLCRRLPSHRTCLSTYFLFVHNACTLCLYGHYVRMYTLCLYGHYVCMDTLFVWTLCVYGHFVCMDTLFGWTLCLYEHYVCINYIYNVEYKLHVFRTPF